MAGRIEPTPIRTDVAALGDYRSRALLGDQPGASGNGANDREQAEEHAPALAPAQLQPATPPPPPAPSAAPFDAALAASRLEAPAPLSRQLLLQRNGAWSPPDSDLHLTDRTA